MEELQSETQQAEPEPSRKIIGLTGGIGSGKTTVAHFIEEFGFPVYYSDDRAKSIVNDNEALKTEIRALLGDHAYDSNGQYDRKFVAEKVFSNAELLQQLNEIIHPAVRLDFEEWVKKQSKYLIFKETALLFELKLNLQCDRSLLVTAEDNIRIKRVMDRDGKTYREVQAIMEKQMPEKEKIKLADCIIYNNSDLEDLKEQTERIVFDIE
ncbi:MULTISPECIES: dephospho-CoA kinase [Chryseobacterium]|uniref:Dephospho-CoA kinase n=1 Tax=Chryseobacterium camelliae TaxID=1265445 RepID=A0ABU0TLS1_9FLAO|nr:MULTISPECIES: dephospho-CoA kinase [Chryseobacterium]MDT3408403.1 dephospho-CoA kinase [Pseudacidovorax intermedius]MDQ1097741.1 dephospho-CoA kinase [Chryseobacterium camelliae]MDQ1101673.1 dephospho-CoA kinase [Chryseobacterium sp. SORGH_AS_1048]MDR6085113.1 dephospho-CoA kinase [Chryseobacterium sp. SORGH_AS_0909]MDR6129469.1 dephospho-CoA kinase [Chryseobacterium sp. SORGH_AS_1175]